MKSFIDSALWYYDTMGWITMPINMLTKAGYFSYALYNEPPYDNPEAAKKMIPRGQIETWFKDFQGQDVGIGVLLVPSGLTVIDYDTYNPNYAKDEIREKVPMNNETAFTVTPHHGFHYFYNRVPELPHKAGILPGLDIRNKSYIPLPPSKNGTGPYVWSGPTKIFLHEKKVLPINNLPTSIIYNLNLILKTSNTSIYNNIYIDTNAQNNGSEVLPLTNSDRKTSNSDKPLTGSDSSDTLTKKTSLTSLTLSRLNFNDHTRNESLFHVANHLSKGGMKIEDTIYLLEQFTTAICKPEYPLKELVTSIESAYKRKDRAEGAVGLELKGWLNVQWGELSLAQIYRDLDVIGKKDKNLIQKILSREVEAGTLERLAKNGFYRKVQLNKNFRDYKNVSANIVNVALPFGFEQYVDIMPGDVITFAAAPNTGKTAIAFEIARLNQLDWPVCFISSEINEFGVNKRLKKYPSDEMNFNDWTFKLITNITENFQDYLEPDAINIIDWIRPPANIWEVGNLLSNIHDKLKGNAIAVCMEQLNPITDQPYGGLSALQIPVVCINIYRKYIDGKETYNLKVTKAKNCKLANVNDFQIKYYCADGIYFKTDDYWKLEYK